MTPDAIKRAHEARKKLQQDRRRSFAAQKHGLHMNHIGEAHPRSKLTAAKVRAIRKRHAKGESMGSIARRYGVTQPCISQIVHRAAWRHVS
ncbi:hypothetical protein Poly30_48670 [Planctomycetes bacterium Poly30]|uniref:HTH psq-type domain-containing protein n=1 Tax=Saltatorellus ferox TaxID=2528018 RepID=A0A518EYZ6_9BACT|nr:hypothetical protein Poly30_48670 [Planctomycetes bacterium Poly30]